MSFWQQVLSAGGAGLFLAVIVFVLGAVLFAIRNRRTGRSGNRHTLAQLISRYVSKADTQETRLEQLNKEKQTLNEEAARLQGELEGLIRSFAIDRKLG